MVFNASNREDSRNEHATEVTRPRVRTWVSCNRRLRPPERRHDRVASV